MLELVSRQIVGVIGFGMELYHQFFVEEIVVYFLHRKEQVKVSSVYAGFLEIVVAEIELIEQRKQPAIEPFLDGNVLAPDFDNLGLCRFVLFPSVSQGNR